MKPLVKIIDAKLATNKHNKNTKIVPKILITVYCTSSIWEGQNLPDVYA